MPLSLSLDCSFLDLTNDDSEYDSSTCSSEDEPLDSYIVPLPRRKTTTRSLRRRCNVYHNELSIGSSRTRDHQSFGDASFLALSDIPWPLVDYEAFLNLEVKPRPMPMDWTRIRSSRTQSPLSTSSSSTYVYPLTPVDQSDSKLSPSAQSQGDSARSTPPKLKDILEDDPSLRRNQSRSSTVLGRHKNEGCRTSVENCIPSVPDSQKTITPVRPLPITHVDPFLALSKTSPSPLENNMESIIGGAFSIELLSPLGSSTHPFRVLPSKTPNSLPRVSIITSSIPMLINEDIKPTSHPSVKSDQSVNKTQEATADRSYQKNPTLAVHRTRTRTSSAESGYDKENQHAKLSIPVKSSITTSQKRLSVKVVE